MILNILSTDENLISQIDKSELFQSVTSITTLDSASSECLIISDEIVPYAELSHNDFSKRKHVFYLMKNQFKANYEKNVKAVCEAKSIHLIPPRLTISQIIESIKEVIDPFQEVENNVVSFISPLSNIGTTSTCLSVAKAISEHSQVKVGVLILNAWDDGTDHLKYKGKSLDEIKSRLSGSPELINDDTEKEVLSYFHSIKENSLYVLAGNRNTKMERLFTKEEIYSLINVSKQIFDVVLIDGGSHFDNINMYQSLKESGLRFLILNQQLKARRKFTQVYQDVLYPLGYKKDDFLLILNQFENKSHYPSTREIYNEVNVPLVTSITHSKNSLNAEMEQSILYSYDDIEYQESIHLIAKSISSVLNLKVDFESAKKKKKIFSFKN